MNLALLKGERVKRGITQEKLATMLGFKDKSSYCLIETGKTSVSVDMASKIAVCLGLSKDITYEIFMTDAWQGQNGICEKLEELCRPVVEYIQKECDPYTEVRITCDNAYLTHVEVGVPIKRGTITKGAD